MLSGARMSPTVGSVTCQRRWRWRAVALSPCRPATVRRETPCSSAVSITARSGCAQDLTATFRQTIGLSERLLTQG